LSLKVPQREQSSASPNVSAMVSRLDADLRKDPQNIEGWKELLRSYAILKEQGKARDALTRALKIFVPTSDAGKELLAVAADLGVSPDARM
jgi:cytochrome c-type biogenesis protein CcmH